MNKGVISKQLIEWLIDFVEKPNSALGNWAPCPFARKARIDNKFKIIFVENTDLASAVEESKQLLDTNDVVAVCFDHSLINGEYTQQFAINANKTLMQEDYVILEDHPDVEEYVHGVKMNFGKCGLLLVQRLSKLNDASDQLLAKGYYNYWNKEEFDNVVGWRNK